MPESDAGSGVVVDKALVGYTYLILELDGASLEIMLFFKPN
jgi:hypothetical protein